LDICHYNSHKPRILPYSMAGAYLARIRAHLQALYFRMGVFAAARIPRRCWTATIADEEEPYTAVRIPWRGWRRPDGDVCIFLASLSH